MEDILIRKLHDYLSDNHRGVLLTLQQEGKVTAYLQDKMTAVNDLYEQLLAEGKPGYVIEEICMEALTKDLEPSKFNYLLLILEEEFETEYYRLKESGTLTYEVINLIHVCKHLFEAFGFTEETESDRQLRYAVTGEIQAYLEDK